MWCLLNIFMYCCPPKIDFHFLPKGESIVSMPFILAHMNTTMITVCVVLWKVVTQAHRGESPYNPHEHDTHSYTTVAWRLSQFSYLWPEQGNREFAFEILCGLLQLPKSDNGSDHLQDLLFSCPGRLDRDSNPWPSSVTASWQSDNGEASRSA